VQDERLRDKTLLVPRMSDGVHLLAWTGSPIS